MVVPVRYDITLLNLVLFVLEDKYPRLVNIEN